MMSSLCKGESSDGVQVKREPEDDTLSITQLETKYTRNLNETGDVKKTDSLAGIKVKLENGTNDCDEVNPTELLRQLFDTKQVNVEKGHDDGVRSDGSSRENAGDGRVIKQEGITIKQENVAREPLNKSPLDDRQTYIRNSVVTLINDSGYGNQATEVTIQRLVGFLMKGTLPTEAELAAIFNITETGSTNNENCTQLNGQISQGENPGTKCSAASSTGPCIDDNTKESIPYRKRVSRPKDAIYTHRRSKDSSSSSTDISPGESNDGSDTPTPPPRYMLRKKEVKNMAEESSSASGSDDDWSPRAESQPHVKAQLQKRRKITPADETGPKSSTALNNKIDHQDVDKTLQTTNSDTGGSGVQPVTIHKEKLDDIHPCTKCVLAFSTHTHLQRHMFRLHYDEYLRLRCENFWHGSNVS